MKAQEHSHWCLFQLDSQVTITVTDGVNLHSCNKALGEEMPWFFSIPEFLKKRACRYLLQHYLGQFLEEKINLDDLTVDLYNGTGSIHNIPLNVKVWYELALSPGRRLPPRSMAWGRG